MATELFFIYDSHCPWSYAATPLINEVSKSLPNITLHLWHNAYYEGDEGISKKQLAEIEKLTNIKFSKDYLNIAAIPKDSTLAANLMGWAQHKTPKQALPLLNKLQHQHFELSDALTSRESIEAIVDDLKLSPPAKVFKTDKLSKDAEATIHDIFSLQEIIGTQAIPALLLAVNDELILLNHNFYLHQPSAIIDAIELELKKHS